MSCILRKWAHTLNLCIYSLFAVMYKRYKEEYEAADVKSVAPCQRLRIIKTNVFLTFFFEQYGWGDSKFTPSSLCSLIIHPPLASLVLSSNGGDRRWAQ